MENPRLLLTGFLPFSNHPENISMLVVEELQTRGLPGIDIEPIILTVDEGGSSLPSKIINEGSEFSAILHLGYSPSSNSINIEIIGRNEYEMKTHDNSGRLIESGRIVQNAPSEIYANLPIAAIKNVVDESPLVDLSWDAGGFVCNETYFRTLLSISTSLHSETPVLFLHLPGRGIMPLEDQLQVVVEISRILCGIV